MRERFCVLGAFREVTHCYGDSERHPVLRLLRQVRPHANIIAMNDRTRKFETIKRWLLKARALAQGGENAVR